MAIPPEIFVYKENAETMAYVDYMSRWVMRTAKENLYIC